MQSNMSACVCVSVHAYHVVCIGVRVLLYTCRCHTTYGILQIMYIHGIGDLSIAVDIER